ncbi:MAG: ribonuclease HIII, partial [Candidatus Cloacimonetes bacterium]|nr:ribonuclease HIII [Candidatus Cloacimonadota bacterium]
MNKQIEHFLAHFLPEIARIGIQVLSQREIDYGLQLRLGREGEQTTLNIYHSEKKGISTVLGKGSPSQLKLDLERVCEELAEPRVPLHEWESWIGS